MHWRECDGTGGISEQDALAETVDIIADDILTGLSLTEAKRLDGGAGPKPPLSPKTAGPPVSNKTTGLYADPSKGASWYTTTGELLFTKGTHC